MKSQEMKTYKLGVTALPNSVASATHGLGALRNSPRFFHSLTHVGPLALLA